MRKVDCYTSPHREPERLSAREMERCGFNEYEYHRMYTPSEVESVATAGFRSDSMFLSMIEYWNETANGTWIYSARKGQLRVGEVK